ncbi:hypothetical protein MKW98_005932 [Papaver atlanticum]|uniref:Uncharacterized protein n=1 Tax=Papaver atlanticum TaxID=357466 RepID=A0AAD4TDP8_9MAGN|nr:hypothetical protein MKW98_005932 [Papaver atlanticum]
MMFNDPHQHHQHLQQQYQLQQQQHQRQQQSLDFYRGPPMRQPSASSTNLTSDCHPTDPTPYNAQGAVLLLNELESLSRGELLIILALWFAICRDATPQVEITGAHENIVWELAWHPIGYILGPGLPGKESTPSDGSVFHHIGSNDHTTRFWCRNRPEVHTGYNQGFGELNPALVGRVPSNFPVPSTPGPFATGLPRSEGTFPSRPGQMYPPLAVHTTAYNLFKCQWFQHLICARNKVFSNFYYLSSSFKYAGAMKVAKRKEMTKKWCGLLLAA